MRIVIADNRPQVRIALRVALEQQPGFKTIGEAIDAQDLITQARAICPDLVIIDWDLDLPIAELIITLRDYCPGLRVIILSHRDDMRDQAITAGANAFVRMGHAPDELLSAVHSCFQSNAGT